MRFTEYLAKKYHFDLAKERALYLTDLTEDRELHEESLINTIMAACAATGISHKDVIGSGRKKEVVEVRHVLAYCIRMRYKNLSLKTISGYLGNRDHATIIHAVSKVSDLLEIGDHAAAAIFKKINPLFDEEPSTTAQNQVNAQAKERETSSATFQNNSILAD